MDEDVANFISITGATNAASVSVFMARFENNLEMAIESFFEVRAVVAASAGRVPASL